MRNHTCIYGKPCFCGASVTQLPRDTYPQNWPMKSDAAGCLVHEIPKRMEQLRRRGVRCEFDPRTGEAIFDNASHRKQVLQAMGMYDRNAGYGDPSPRNQIAPEDRP